MSLENGSKQRLQLLFDAVPCVSKHASSHALMCFHKTETPFLQTSKSNRKSIHTAQVHSTGTKKALLSLNSILPALTEQKSSVSFIIPLPSPCKKLMYKQQPPTTRNIYMFLGLFI